MKSILWTLLLAGGLYGATHSAKVIETLNSGGYTYINVQEGSENYWIAMTERSVAKGAMIAFDEQGWMQNFHSKTLDRTFDKILFASDAAGRSSASLQPIKPDVMTSQYKEAGTVSIAELFADRDRYVGQKVRVRGLVTKTSAQIMKKNWVHLQDGSSYRGQDDLVFTTTVQMPKQGSVIVAEGIVTKDKDFGYGYFYPVIVEESSFAVK